MEYQFGSPLPGHAPAGALSAISNRISRRQVTVPKAHRYFELIRSGKTYAGIAAAEGVSKQRIQILVDLAFLAPDVVRDVFVGSQPTGLTTEWLLRHAVPALWNEQRDLFRAL
jgi:cystathionine beta-lyase family protein involved in aluminum resistance